MIYSIKCFGQIYKNAQYVNAFINTCVFDSKLNNSMISGMSFLKTKLFVVKQMFSVKYKYIQSVIHNSFLGPKNYLIYILVVLL